MIYDLISNYERYKGLGENIYKGLKTLAEADFSTMEDGRYPLDGDKLFMSLSHNDTRSPVGARAEAHKAYIDIQYLVEGEELITYSPLSMAGEAVDGRPEGDIWFYDAPICMTVPLHGKFFALFFPEDSHAPGIEVGAPGKTRKALIKVRVSN